MKWEIENRDVRMSDNEAGILLLELYRNDWPEDAKPMKLSINFSIKTWREYRGECHGVPAHETLSEEEFVDCEAELEGQSFQLAEEQLDEYLPDHWSQYL